MQALLDTVDVNSRTGVRDKALLLLLYNTGARVSEIVGIKTPDLRLQGATPQVSLLGKGKKHRSCPLWPETAQALQDYLKFRTPKDPATEQIFLNANGAPVTRFGVRHIIRKYAASARSQCSSLRVKLVTPHTIRHTTPCICCEPVTMSIWSATGWDTPTSIPPISMLKSIWT